VAALDRVGQHLGRELELGPEAHILGHRGPWRVPLGRVGEPGFDQIEPPIDEGVAVGAGIAHEHPDLAVADPPEGAAVLAADAGRMDPLLREARVVEDEHPARGPELLAHEALQLADAAHVVPGRVRQELLELARWRADLLGDVLHVLALDRQGQADQVLAAEGASLRPAEEAGEAGVEAFERRQQGFEIRVRENGDPFPSGPPGQTASAALSGSHCTVNRSDREQPAL